MTNLVDSGTYTPTVTNIVNLASPVAKTLQWKRINNVVIISGQVEVRPAAGVPTFSEIDFSLPIASTFSTAFQGSGTGATPVRFSQIAAFASNASTDKMRMSFMVDSTDTHSWFFTFMYQII